MTPEEFVKACHNEKQGFLKQYLSDNPQTEVGELINPLNLTDQLTGIMKKIVNSSLTDIFYAILL